MSTSKPLYDPVKTVEGMFMGSVTRIAYAMKDPLNYAQSTKAVLAETAKKFQDALDDCEIQILHAKWYLERQLDLNRARREAKAREESAASAKRKREASKDTQDTAQNADGESAPKRVKTQEPEDSTQPQPKPQQPSPAQKPAAKPSAIPTKPTTQPAPVVTEKAAATKPSDKPKVSMATDVKARQATAAPPFKPQEKPPEPVQPPERTMTQTTTDDFPKPTLQDTPADGNEAFNFESMFGEPSADMMDGAGNDMGFDLENLGGDGFGADTSNLDVHDNSLNSLLPGLESYANQAGDDSSFNMPGMTTNGLPSGPGAAIGGGAGNVGRGDTTNAQQQQSVDDFGLPQLGPNEFDDFLDANEVNFDENINLDGNGMMNMDNLENMDMDFDSMFN